MTTTDTCCRCSTPLKRGKESMCGICNACERLDDHIERAILSAQVHGEQSEPDHEVGDLQDLVRALWALLPPGQRAVFADDETFRERIADWRRQ